jgi:ion channel-forming bestrophin family protein
MWVDKRRSWIATVALGGFALPHIWTRTLTVTGISVVVTVLYETVPRLHYSLTATPFSLIGFALGIYLGFRNNTAYDRFWEARKLWGSLVNTSRSLARQILTLPEVTHDAADPSAEALRRFQVGFVHFVIGYAHALRHHLRDADPTRTLARILPEEEVTKLRELENVPLAILQRLGELAAEARRRGWLHAFHVPVVEGSLSALTDIQGGCERIKATPIPYSYTVLMHRLVGVYCTLLPLGLMDTVKWATPFVVLFISYTFFGLDAVGDEVEQPFGFQTNDLPLNAMSVTIERNLRERLGESDLPPPVAPRRGVLS